MKLFSFGKKKSEEEKAREQELKQQQKAEKARLQELKKQQKAHDAVARKAVKDEKKRVKREEKEWKKQEKQLRDREKQEQKEVENREKQARKVVEKREKQERKRVKKLERQHATTRRREERRRRKALMRNRRKMRKLRKLQKKQRRAQDPSVHQRQIDELLAETASEQSPLSQDPIAVVATCSSTAAAAPAFKKRANCFTCRSKFRVNRIRHHCRNCGESCCRKCLSDVKRPIPWQGKNKPQKICVMCDTLVFSDRTAASLAVENAVASASAVRVPSRSNSVEATPEVASPPASSSSSSSRPASGSGITVSLSSRSNRLRRNDSGSSSMKSKKPSLWTLPIRPLLKRKRSVEQLRNRQLDFELQLEKAAQLSRQGQKTLEIELQPQHSTLAAPLARVS